MNRVILGLGSNTIYEDREPLRLLASGIKSLEKIFKDCVFSSIYKSKALYYENQADFYNMVFMGFLDESISPRDLLNEIHLIEALHGRDRNKEIRFGPRPLDIDIEEFGNIVLNEKDLIIPHERFREREFVLIPELELFRKICDTEKIKETETYLNQLSSQGVTLCSSDIQQKFTNIYRSSK